MQTLDQIYTRLVETPSDINEHLPTLRKYAEECDHVTEMGVRGICSTWALLAALPKTLISYDLQNPSNWGANINDVYEVASLHEVNFKFIEADVLTVNIDETDFLFIDTWHVYQQLKAELELHAVRVKKYIAFHDTVSFGIQGESTGHEGINRAITEFLTSHPEWKIEREFLNNNGFLIIKRVL